MKYSYLDSFNESTMIDEDIPEEIIDVKDYNNVDYFGEKKYELHGVGNCAKEMTETECAKAALTLSKTGTMGIINASNRPKCYGFYANRGTASEFAKVYYNKKSARQTSRCSVYRPCVCPATEDEASPHELGEVSGDKQAQARTLLEHEHMEITWMMKQGQNLKVYNFLDALNHYRMDSSRIVSDKKSHNNWESDRTKTAEAALAVVDEFVDSIADEPQYTKLMDIRNKITKAVQIVFPQWPYKNSVRETDAPATTVPATTLPATLHSLSGVQLLNKRNDSNSDQYLEHVDLVEVTSGKGCPSGYTMYSNDCARYAASIDAPYDGDTNNSRRPTCYIYKVDENHKSYGKVYYNWHKDGKTAKCTKERPCICHPDNVQLKPQDIDAPHIYSRSGCQFLFLNNACKEADKPVPEIPGKWYKDMIGENMLGVKDERTCFARNEAIAKSCKTDKKNVLMAYNRKIQPFTDFPEDEDEEEGEEEEEAVVAAQIVQATDKPVLVTVPTTLPPTTLAPTTLPATTLTPTTMVATTLAATLAVTKAPGKQIKLSGLKEGGNCARDPDKQDPTMEQCKAAAALAGEATMTVINSRRRPKCFQYLVNETHKSYGKVYFNTSEPTSNCSKGRQCICANKEVEVVDATTMAPTTVTPITMAPTTMAPTTMAPTTMAPTTMAPTTMAPTTMAPTTMAPTTMAPTTMAPTTMAPTTMAPTTMAATEAPSGSGVPPEIVAILVRLVPPEIAEILLRLLG